MEPTSTGPLFVAGVLHKVVGTKTTDEGEVSITEPLEGWHVNAPWAIADFAQYAHTPEVIAQEFAGGQTHTYKFSDEAQFLQALESADLSQPPPPEPIPDPKFLGVEFEGVMCSATSDDATGLLQVHAGFQIVGPEFTTVFRFKNGTKLALSAKNFGALMAVWVPFRQGFFTE